MKLGAEAATDCVLQKKVFLKIHRKTPVMESLFVKLQARPITLLKRDSNTDAFCEICEILKTLIIRPPALISHHRLLATGP